MRTRQKQCVATDTWRSLGCGTPPLEQWRKKKTNSWTPVGQATDKPLKAPSNSLLFQGGASLVGCSVCQYLSAFGLPLTFYLGYPVGHLLGKSCRLRFPLVLFLFHAIFIVCVPFPFGVWERMWNWIVSLPDYCLFIYFPAIFRPHLTVCLE